MNTPAPAATAGDQAATVAAAPPRLVRFAVDSDDLGSLFAADFVRTYSDLIPTESDLDALQARFPDSTIELIDRGLGDPTGQANLYDVEDGALTAGQAAARVREQQAAGRPWQGIYSDRSALDDVNAACRAAGVDAWWRWIATFDTMVVPQYPDAQIQFANAAMLGIHADLTVVWNPAYRPSAARAAVAQAPAQTAAVAAPVAVHTAAAAELAAKAHEVFEAAAAHHGRLSLLERDLAEVPDMLVHHANLLGELSDLTRAVAG